MKDLQKVKAIAEQLLALSIELLRLFDSDEQERNTLIENVKKTPTEKFCSFQAVKIRPKMRISKAMKICEN